MIRSKSFFGSTIVYIFSLIHKEEDVKPDGTLKLFAESSVSACQRFRLVDPFFGMKVPFLAFLKYRKGCSHIDMLMTFPGDSDSKYIWVCGSSSIIFSGKSTICFF